MSRPRGYAEWIETPRNAHAFDTIRDVQEILEEYRAHLPMTVRQVFYRLVGAYGFEKTEKAYGRLCEWMVKARRSQIIGFDVIRDDGNLSEGGDYGYDAPADFVDVIKRSASGYSRPKRQGQPHRVELWCEAKGMVPMLARAARPYGVEVIATGGFSSVTTTYDLAQRAIEDKTPLVVLHAGDFDPSGESIFDAISEDARAFVVGEGYASSAFVARRIALTQDQVDRYDLPTAPPKPSDTRSANWVGETCQLEAMPPDLLASTVDAAVAEWTDLELLEEVADRGKAERAELTAKLAAALVDFE